MIRALLAKPPILPLLTYLPILVRRRTRPLHRSHGALRLVRVRINVRNHWFCGAIEGFRAGTGGVGGGRGLVGGVCRIGDLGAVGGGATDVAVTFENFFCGYVGRVIVESGVVEDRLEVFGDLVAVVSLVCWKELEEVILTWHIWSLHSIREFTASIARKLLSSMPTKGVFSLRMLGVMTVARLWVSILLPVSSSTAEKEEAQTKKEKRISRESRWLFGRRQQVRCKTLLRFSSSAISTRWLA